MADEQEQQPFAQAASIDERDSFFKNDLPTLFDKLATVSTPLTADDVTFIVEDARFKAKRPVLASQSPVLATLLFSGSFRESNENKPLTISLPGKSAKAFGAFLEFMTTRKLEIKQLDLDTAIEVAMISHEYQVEALTLPMIQRLAKVVSTENLHKMFNTASLLGYAEFLAVCHLFISADGRGFLADPKFCELSLCAVVEAVSRDCLSAPEIEILFAIERWQETNRIHDISSILRHVRFDLVSVNGHYSLQSISSLIKFLEENNVKLANVGVSQNGSVPHNLRLDTYGNAHENVLPVPLRSYSICTRSSNDESVFRLDRACLIESMGFSAFRYFIGFKSSGSPYVDCGPAGFHLETSIDGRNWDYLHSQSEFRGEALLIFKPRAMQYVKIRITSTQAADLYVVQSFRCPAQVPLDRKLKYLKICADQKSKDNIMVVFETNKVSVFEQES